MIVDALNLAFRWKHSEEEDFFDDYVETVKSLGRSYKAKHVIIAADKGSSQYRKNLYPDYKGNRQEKFAEQSEDDFNKFKKFIDDYEYTLGYIQQETDWPIFRFDRTEADDIAAYIVSTKLPVEHTWLISSDKDWDLLVSPIVSRFSYVTRKEISIDNWPYSCTPEQLSSVKCLTGDAGDNIIGVEGIGEKRATELINKYGDIFDIIAALPLPGKSKYIENLNNSKDKLLLNSQLIDLVSFCRDALGSNFSKIDDSLSQVFNFKE